MRQLLELLSLYLFGENTHTLAYILLGVFILAALPLVAYVIYISYYDMFSAKSAKK
jgi:hypothetical protein